MDCRVYSIVQIKYRITIPQRLGERKWMFTVVSSYTICKILYYLKVNCNKLKIYTANPNKPSHKQFKKRDNKQEQR